MKYFFLINNNKLKIALNFNLFNLFFFKLLKMNLNTSFNYSNLRIPDDIA